jgi:hypothetical protein
MTLSASLIEAINNTVIEVGGTRYALHVRDDNAWPTVMRRGVQYVTIEALEVDGTRTVASHFPVAAGPDDRRTLTAVIDHLRLMLSSRSGS